MYRNILFLICFLFLFGKADAQKVFTSEDVDSLKQHIQQAMVDWKIPGLAIGIVQDGKVVMAEGFGVCKLGEDQKVDANTMFGIASNTKAFTASALGLLVNEGKLSWDDRVVDYLPYFELYDPYVSQNFTIRDLLCHRSGLATFSGDLLWHSTSYSREEIIRRIKYLKPVYGFRSHYGYSNLMFLTAGEIIPAITDTSFDDFLKYRFFEPLEMQNTNISIRFQKGYSNLAIPHITKEDKVIPIDYISWDNIAPAGGINSTVNDMNHWLLMQLESGSWNGKVILPEEIQQELWSSNMVQNVSNMQHFLFPSIHFNTYGMGWDLFDYHGRKVVNHSGGLDGMISQVALVPEEKFGVVILTNSMNYLPYALMHTVIDLLMDYEGKNYSSIMNKLVNRNKEMEQLSIEKEEQSRNIKSKPSLALEDYTGVYTSKMYGDAEVKITDDQLFVQFKPAPVFKSKLEHWQYDTFKIEFKAFPSLPEGKLTFTINSLGKVEKMLIDVPNPDFDFTELDFVKVH